MSQPRCALHGIELCPLCHAYPPDWPRCQCGLPVMDGHLTCGNAECEEGPARERRPPPPPLRTSKYNIAIGKDGHPLPYSPDEVTAVSQKALQDGNLVAVLLRLPTGDLAFQVFGPPSYELVEMLESVVNQYKRALDLQVAPPGGRA